MTMPFCLIKNIVLVPKMRNNCDSNIELFSFDPCKVIALNLLCFIYALFFIAFSKVISKRAATIAIAILGSAITIWRAIQKRNH